MVDLFCVKKQHVKLLGCLCTGAPSLIFDQILNVALSEEISTTGVTQGILEFALLPDSLD